MINVISISTDRGLFVEGSAVQTRHISYGKLFSELHIIVFTKATSKLPEKMQISQNVWVYGTHSLFKFQYISKAVAIGLQLIRDRHFLPENTVMSVQNPFETGLVGAKLARQSRLSLHVQIHTDFLNPYFIRESIANRLRSRLALKVLKRASAVRIVSKKIADSIPRGMLKNDVVPMVLPIFVDTKKIDEAPLCAEKNLKTKYPQFNFILLIASRFTKEKNISFALSVLSHLLKEYPKLGLIIVGSGPEKNMLHKRSQQSDLAGHVFFEDWQSDVTSYYKSANLFLSTSNYEGYGMTIIEAIAAGCPTVSTDVGIACEVLREGERSFACPIGKLDCFTDAVSSLIEDNSLRERFIREARSRLPDVVLEDEEKYLSLYRESVESAL